MQKVSPGGASCIHQSNNISEESSAPAALVSVLDGLVRVGRVHASNDLTRVDGGGFSDESGFIPLLDR